MDAAKRAIKTVRQGVKVLGHQPRIGRPIEDLPDEFREWLIDFGDSGYVVRYRIDADAVTILAVGHQKEVGF
jgi:plasmid stabilization system protein ParE